MAIKVTKTSASEKPYYPVVCKHEEHADLIVLLTSRSTGVCISPETHSSYGQHTADWDDRESVWIPVCVTIDSTGIA